MECYGIPWNLLIIAWTLLSRGGGFGNQFSGTLSPPQTIAITPRYVGIVTVGEGSRRRWGRLGAAPSTPWPSTWRMVVHTREGLLRKEEYD